MGQSQAIAGSAMRFSLAKGHIERTHLARIGQVNHVRHILFLPNGLAVLAGYNVLRIDSTQLSDRSRGWI